MRNLGITVILTLVCLNGNSQAMQFDGEKVYYENIIDLPGKHKQDIFNDLKKFLATKNYFVRYADDGEIHATTRFDAVYKGWFLFMYNSTEYKVYHNIAFHIKHEKMKYVATDFKLVPYTYNIPFDAWGSTWSSGNIQTGVPSTPVEKHYKSGKTKKRHKLFPTITNQIKNMDKQLREDLTASQKDDW